MGFSFRPTLWPTLLTIPAVMLLLAMGGWQLDRLQWKRAILAEMETNFAKPPLLLPASIADSKGFAFRRVRVTGRFLHDLEMHLSVRVRNGRPGVEVVTPLEREDGSVIMVNRGWVPMDRQEVESRPAGLVSGIITVEGVLRMDRPKGGFTPENVPEEGLWFHVDLAEMGRFAGKDRVLPVLLEAGLAEIPGRYPIGKAPVIDIKNDHLAYAITWYLLALILVVIYFIYHRRARN